MDLSNYGWGLPIRASTYAAKIDNSLMILHVAMLLIFVLWAVYMAYCLVRYRKGRNPAAAYGGSKGSFASYTPDVLIFAFEVWLIFVIGVPIWAHIKEDLPKPESSTVVKVVAEQFSWTIQYPGPDGQFGRTDVKLVNVVNPLGLDPDDPNSQDDVIAVNELRVPLGKPVLIYLSAKDVIHSFFVPEFRIKQDAVPGMRIPVWVEPTLAGRFEIACAQLCGAGHYRMRGDVFVLPPEEFEGWMQKRQAEKGT